jgi:hypothetical protein
MGATSLALFVTVAIAMYIAHLLRASRLRNRIEQWSENRAPMTDDQFYEALEPISATRNGAISVRSLVSAALRIPQELVYPDDTLSDLKKVGNPSHPSVVDYIADMSSIEPGQDEDDLTTVRDLVVKFGLTLVQAEPQPRL